MQLLHESKAVVMTIKDTNMTENISKKNASPDIFDAKDKKSDASLLMMNPVASGDNVATGLNSAHRLKVELPPLVPCCEGRELQINEDVVRSGLSAISVKHDSVIQCLSMSYACERMQVPPGLVKHRNSFRCLHRPDLKRVPYLRRMTPDELEIIFRGYADISTLTPRKDNLEETTRVLHPPSASNPKQDLKCKEPKPVDGNAINTIHPIADTRSGAGAGAEDVPAGMRLHGARARLYTSVLAGTKVGDQLSGGSVTEEYDTRVSDDPLPEEEIQLNEEVQIILPPRCDDVTADSTITTTSTDSK